MVGQGMRLVKRVREYLDSWRQRTEGMQYQSGYDSAYTAFYLEGQSLEAIARNCQPSSCHFDRGVMQALIEIERKAQPVYVGDIAFNEKGQPVDVPFFVETT